MANRFIERLQELGDLTVADVRALEDATQHRRAIGARTDLIREGDPLSSMFVVLEGWVISYKVLPAGARQIMALLIPGDCCDLSINQSIRMDHSIQTVTPVEIVKIDSETVRDLMNRHPRIARAMYIARIVDQKILQAWIVSLGRRSGVERVAHLLLELYVRCVCRGLNTDQGLELPLPQTIIADALGMTAVHINRLLQVLRRSGAIELERGLLRIQSAAVLTSVCGLSEKYLERRLLDYLYLGMSKSRRAH